MRFIQAIIALGALVCETNAVLVAPDSPCQSNCGNVLQATTEDQIVCSDGDYGTTAGKVFQSCVTCESTSPYTVTDGNQTASDLHSMLFNMRYTAAQCLFNLTAGPCATIYGCGRLQNALEYANLSSSVSLYGYCSLWSDYEIDKCGDCLRSDNKAYISNFITILSGACGLQAERPETIPLIGNIFSDDQVNVTSPTNTATVHTHNRVGPLDTGALVGIVIGGVVLILIFAGCGVVINGKRRRKNYLRRREERTKNWPKSPGAGEMFETPLSQRPLRGWGDSPVSAATTDGAYPYPPYFSPYASQFNSPVSAVESHGPVAWPVEKAQSIGLALSPDHEKPESPWGDRKGKERADVDMDSYELQEGVNSAGGYGPQVLPPPSMPSEAPVLNHPGYGRQGHAHPQQ